MMPGNAQSAEIAAPLRSWYKWAVLGLLLLVGLTNYMDRLSISILQVPIKADLGLSDTELGAITGLSFSLVYTLAALPIARFADRVSPKTVILVCLVLWNALTMLCGLANGFFALAVLRMGVAIGEAGCTPAAQALLATHFPPHQRGRAIAIWQMVFPLGTLLGIFFSGMLSAALGWRVAFVAVGGVGLCVAPLILLFLRTPPASSGACPAGSAGEGMNAALRHVLATRTYRLLIIAGFFGAIPLNAALNWNAPIYGRLFGLSMKDITLVSALIAGVGGAIGMVGGGFLCDLLGRRDRRWYCWVPAAGLLIVPLLLLFQYRIAQSAAMSVPFGLIGGIVLNSWMPPQAAIAQSLVWPAHRAVAAAGIVVTAGLGAAVGPFVTGLISDLLVEQGLNTGEALSSAVALVSLAAIPAALLFFAAGNFLQADLSGATHPA